MHNQLHGNGYMFGCTSELLAFKLICYVYHVDFRGWGVGDMGIGDLVVLVFVVCVFIYTLLIAGLEVDWWD